MEVRAAVPTPLSGTAGMWNGLSVHKLQNAMLWLTAAGGGLVFIEPSPYEIFSLLAMLLFVATGLSLRPALLPLIALLALLNIGYTISAADLLDQEQIRTWILTSWFLGLTSIFFAACILENTEARLNALVHGYMFAAVIASIAAIVGYARIFPSLDDLLLLYERSRGTFKDPNVLGAFLVFPALIALQRVVVGHFWQVVRNGFLLILFAAAVFLAFSRGAWGQTVFTSALMLALMFITTHSPHHRVRVVMIALAAIVAVGLFIVVLLSIDAVAELFKQRASLEQSYDLGEFGRFHRYVLGGLMALDRPFGIGPLQFSKFFPEDTHNSYLNAFMSGGWLSGVCYPVLIALTFVHGLRTVFVPTPWRNLHIVVFAAFTGTMFESFIIDSDHWRHYLMFIGLMWGLIVAARPYSLVSKRRQHRQMSQPSASALASAPRAS